MPDALKSAAKRVLSRDQRLALRRLARSAQRRIPGDLTALGRHHGTDKADTGLTDAYRRHFSRGRREVRTVLEIGVGGISSLHGYETVSGGHSLRMWRDYFPQAQIIGADLHHKDVAGDRIRFEQGDQSDPAFLRALAERHGPFDIVIDDGSHIGRHVAVSFEHLWAAVKPGGFYAIEDLAAAYDPSYEGGEPGTPGTAAMLIKDQVDRAIRRPETPPRSTGPVAAIHLYPNVVILEKAR